MDLVITSPLYLDETTFEGIFIQWGRNHNERIDTLLLDMGNIEFIDPYGMVGTLEFGRFLKSLRIYPVLNLPKSKAVLRYLERMDFLRFALNTYQIQGTLPTFRDKYFRSKDSDVLLEITKIEDSNDIHNIVGEVKSRAKSILQAHLNYDEKTTHGFIVALSEICQNILEHSENVGFVGIQKYFYQKRLRKNMVKIAVMDLGIGIKNSLENKLFPLFEDKWSDILAIEQALIHGTSRHSEVGRGHGLTSVRRFVNQWSGKFSIRSGTAKLSIIPYWDKDRNRQSNLSLFPGTQISLVLPEI
ncbi:MAG: ATP-binding protein [Thermodesulfobacteriota bacterium]